jgi:hypothetical protein
MHKYTQRVRPPGCFCINMPKGSDPKRIFMHAPFGPPVSSPSPPPAGRAADTCRIGKGLRPLRSGAGLCRVGAGACTGRNGGFAGVKKPVESGGLRVSRTQKALPEGRAAQNGVLFLTGSDPLLGV